MIEIVEVLLARIASSLSTSASCLYVAIFASSFSVIASITTSRSARMPCPVEVLKAGEHVGQVHRALPGRS